MIMPLLVLAVACGGASTPSPAAPEPTVKPPEVSPPATAPAPSPIDVVEADGSCRWYGATFPLSGGELTNCSARAVSTHHAQGKAPDLLAQYTKALEAAGFTRVDQPGDPTLKRADLTVQLATYASTDDPGIDVILMRR